ncbi:hypothetical protein EVJ22_05595 [Exiguobacterium sp. SH0S7]|uniref:hypothetical protein n=1 Tax=Exiguobacterium sp. SH0S7 TaxID=2510951 RepID=UPI00103F8478|nr:hypothetical protein [Exiguobacterium sp. SH0S7]TCI72131.1 hypothetical protein EVJ22_05595 [Exiguobacterium sp. SH0S7]
MHKREEGYVLVLVLVTMAALAVLSLAAMQVNLVTNKLTVIRTEDTQLNEDAKSALNLIAADVRNRFPLHDANDVPAHMESESAFNDAIQGALVSNEPFLNLPSESDSEISYSIQLKENADANLLDTAPFTKILQVNVVASRQTNPEQPLLSVEYTQDLYLTALPAFLYYVLGSDEQLTVNGMPTVQGNIFSGGPLAFDRTANYQLNGVAKRIDNIDTSLLHLDGRIDLKNPNDCTTCSKLNYFTSGEEVAGELPDAGISTSQFSPFQYDYSIIEFLNRYLNQKLSYTSTVDAAIFNGVLIPSTDQVFEVERILAEDGVTVIERPTPYLTARTYNAFTNPTIIKLPTTLSDRAMYVTESIAKASAPLLFDGDLVIESTDRLTIERPLIVRGNLTIRGNVSFESTVYTLGDTFIDRANILPIDESKGNSLILLSKGKILLNRINEFDQTPTTLQAFLYSDSSEPTYVYAVGSILQIKGGLYSKGPMNVNVFRGTFSTQDNLSPAEYFDSRIPAHDASQSRLKLSYNDAVFNQLDTLPVTNQLQFFVSQPVQIR